MEGEGRERRSKEGMVRERSGEGGVEFEEGLGEEEREGWGGG